MVQLSTYCSVDIVLVLAACMHAEYTEYRVVKFSMNFHKGAAIS